MMRLTATTFPLLATLLAPFAVSQDGADVGLSAQPAKITRVLPELRAYQVDDDQVRVGVVGLQADDGDPRIIVCGLPTVQDWQVEPTGTAKTALGHLVPIAALQVVEFGELDVVRLAPFQVALLPVVIHRDGQVVFGRAKTVKTLLADADRGRIAPVGLDGDKKDCPLPKLDIRVLSTDSIPPEFGLDIRTWVHPPGQTLTLDEVRKACTDDTDLGFDVYLSIAGGFGGPGTDQTGEELRVHAHLGLGEGAEARVWLRRVYTLASGDYCLVRRITLRP